MSKKKLTEAEAVALINSIKQRYPDHRQKGKTVTFAAQYGGSTGTFESAGLPKEEAIKVYDNYHKLYKQSGIWKDEQLFQATRNGYATLAFGAKLRTNRMAYKGTLTYVEQKGLEAERRSVGNALTQSYGFLNSRAFNEFMRTVWASEYKYTIMPAALIHDASYYVIPDDVDAVHFVNTHLIKAMQWQELPELQHDTVKLGGELDLFIDWATPITVKNGASKKEIEDTVVQAGIDYRADKVD